MAAAPPSERLLRGRRSSVGSGSGWGSGENASVGSSGAWAGGTGAGVPSGPS